MYDGWANLGSNLVKTQFSALWKESSYINNGGNMGIGIAEPREKLHIVGNLQVDGTIINEPPKKFTAGHAYEIGEDLSGKEGFALVMKAGKVFISTTPKDKRVIGFLEKIFEGKSSLDNSSHDNLAAVMGLGDSRHWEEKTITDASGKVISVNEINTIKGVNVCNENGNIEIGDFLATSSRAGYLMKQDDNLVHNYTAARCMEDIVFDASEIKNGIYCIMMCG